jgi:hypothetical protein
LTILPRSLYHASLSATPEQFAYIASTVGHVSDVQSQTLYRVKILEDDKKVKACHDAEEKEGRINCDMLSRFVIIGGPVVPASPELQAQLVSQVYFIFILVLFTF